MRRVVVVPTLAAVLVVAAAGAAAADTIYLTNGRVIHTAAARIEGDRVVFRQYGGEVSIPRQTVVRIVDDDRVEHVTPPPIPAPASGATAPPAAVPGATSAYWSERIRAADARIARAQAELDRLPEYRDADRLLLRYNGQARYFMAERDKWQRMLWRFQATRKQLLAGARRAGMSPGALRDGLRD